jgi:hypothetical protein
MSWVLILRSNYHAEPPAVLGGFKSITEAERAGDAATQFGEPAPDAPLGWYSVARPHYSKFFVIPGIDEEVIASVYCSIDDDGSGSGRLLRIKHRYGPAGHQVEGYNVQGS